MNLNSQDQFEQAYSEDNGGLPVEFLKLDRLGESYGTLKVARAWYWWKRARAGVVALGKRVSFDMQGLVEDDEGELLFFDDTIEAIEAHGLKMQGHDALNITPFKIITLPPSLVDHPARNALDDALAKVGVKVAS